MNCRDVVEVELPTEHDSRTETGWLVCQCANRANVAEGASHPLNCRGGESKQALSGMAPYDR